ncbi:MAG: KxYKxGKxW signal peptide domain-containing protein [Streptococcus sp.]
MFFRRNEGQYRETDRVTRFKLVKSGKHWLLCRNLSLWAF